ncbi:hypothetical protein ACQ4M3_28935 [Leptolyngbya sp. AN03gr2]|uniref:hypothetical protein n=1 Tax=unclassified Leptolyngbya TaxID=2650499 RepID=UPI003D320499
MFLVLIETSGNQDYIFSTNKLRENVGASELTFQAGTSWILEAVAENGGSPLLRVWQAELQESELRRKLIDQNQNPAIDSPQHGRTAEIIVAASGKALIITKDEQTAKAIIQSVSLRALKEAPGLDLFGVFHKFDWEHDPLYEVVEIVHQKFVKARSRKPSQNLRFLRLPVVAECATSGLPAAIVDPNAPGGSVLRSMVAHKKRNQYDSNIHRIQRLLDRNEIKKNFARSIKVLDQELNDESDTSERLSQWRSVIHADGNGLGEIFLKFGQHLETLGKVTGDLRQDNRTYVDCLRRFSLALDVCTERAFITAIRSLKLNNESLLPIVPLVLGGDDLTIVCDGQFALPFTEQFLRAFEAETTKRDSEHYDGTVAEVAKVALGVDRMSACAGVAIIKPHFPFSVAYELSEDLMQSAKTVKQNLTHEVGSRRIPYPCSALDFHVLYDSSGVELSRIRKRLEPETSTYLYIAPYVVTPLEQLNVANAMKTWANQHHWSHLKRRIQALLATDENGRRKLPNSQMHDLRNALLLGANLADARFRLMRSRYIDPESPIDIRALEGDPESLFTQNTSYRNTGLLDALDAADFVATANPNQDEDC